MVTKVEQDLDYSMVIVVDSIEIDFVLVDYSVALMTYQVMMNYKMDNVVVEQQVLLVDIAIVDEMMVVVNVVLKQKYFLYENNQQSKFFTLLILKWILT